MQDVSFEKSARKHKKYKATINYRDGRTQVVHFGDNRYQQFKDSTGVGAWSHLDHNDQARRSAYMRRHGSPGRMYTASWFAWHYLW